MVAAMLIEFSVANFRSIKERQTLSLVASSDSQLRETNVALGKDGVDLLRMAALFGPNASGKSNFFRAMHALQRLVQASALALQQGQPLPLVVPFRLAADSQDKPSEFEINFIAGDGVRYQYGFAAQPERIASEWLIAYPHGRQQRWFERDHRTQDDRVWKFGPNFQSERGQRKVWQESTRDNALFLSTAIQLNNAQLRPAFEWLTQRLIVLPPGMDMNPLLSIELLKTEDGLKRVMDFMRVADIGIDHLELREEDPPAPLAPPPGMMRLNIQLRPSRPGRSSRRDRTK
ncbi:hypothetical protein B1B_15964, partial [mine drainage metagenome]